jgi:CspA family cold shock protein
MPQGTIKKLVSDRGFGFILLDGEQESGKDLFFHRNDVQGAGYDALREGDQVTYDEANDERRNRPKAANVQSASNS